jgi:hypothetical protein
MDLWGEIEQKIKELDVSVRALRKTGTEFATAERDYKKRLREEALKLKADGMAVTLIDKVVYGIPEVAELRFKRDVCEAVYQANQESINVLKLNIRIIESQLNREWGQAKYDGIR